MKLLNVLMVTLSAVASAQSTVPVREIGKLERVSTLPFQAVTAVISMSDGRVLVNDGRARRLIMLDSTLSRETVITDTMGTTPDSYARGSGEVLFRFRGDSALIVNISTAVGLVISPQGKVARALAFPPPPGHPVGQQVVIGGRGSLPALDARGRLVFSTSGAGGGFGITSLPLGMSMDSATVAGFPGIVARSSATSIAPLWRVDLTTRRFDTASVIRIPNFRTSFKTDANNGLVAIEMTPDLMPHVDAWTMTADGTLAIVRGIDYHMEWISADGRATVSPKMSFAWERLSDERKEALVDSAVKQMQLQFDASGAGRGGRTGGPGRAPNVAVRPSINDLPQYVPAFDRDGIRADADGNVWIKTSTIIKDRPVYDIVNRKGEIVDRVQLPAFRVISGFAPGVVFMAVQDSTNVVRLERARIR